MSAAPGTRVVFGIRPVEELCRAHARAVSVVYIAEGTHSSELAAAAALARERGIAVETRPRQLIGALADGGVHQGIVAVTGEYRYADMGEILAAVDASGEPALLLLLDGITDPHNLGALVRSAEVLGAHAVVVPDRNAAPVTPAAVKASAGATERVKVARVGNLLRTMDALRERGIRVLGGGADAADGARIDTVDLRVPVALVVGAEGRGMREAVARRCDALFHIPQRGGVSSLNASVAGAIALYEAARQRLPDYANVPRPEV
ncbi:MAG TPA: 23S rRNA (guanosine(2251)-2'-O)-methyltransferase RlmB [Polyangia bacterium]|nr:23S rRNA (guanosine(2251)-2'-O)-methyltransferase RlmB [Polyangia bacterium]